MKTYRIALSTLLLTGALSACGGQVGFVRPGVTQEQAQKDLAACEYDFDSKETSGNLVILQRSSLISKCMASKGYSTVTR